jgi:hypothetical protein
MVSAEATGLGEPMEAIIDKIETFMGQTLVTVTYTRPTALSGLGGCFVDVHITLKEY